MADIIYNRFLYNLLEKLVDLGSGGDTINVALLDNTYSPNKDHNVWADVSAKEISGTGYTAGGAALANQAVTQDDANDKAKWDADDQTWSNATITARYAIIRDVTLDCLICCFDLGSDKSSEANDFTIQWHTDGILNLAQGA